MKIPRILSRSLALLLALAPALEAATSADFAAASVELIGAAKSSQRLTGSDGLFDRVFIKEKETVRLRIALPALVAGKELTITAPNGGKVEPVGKGAKLRFAPRTTDPAIVELDFTPTLGRGAYTILVQQGGATVTLDLWAGSLTPTGEPGPAYVPVPNTEPETVP